MKFLSKIKKPGHARSRTPSLIGGSAVLVLMLALFVQAGIPTKVYAWIIHPSMSYSQVFTGGYTTISWSGPTADYCDLSSPSAVLPSTCYDQPTMTGMTCDKNGSCTATYGPPYTHTCTNHTGLMWAQSGTVSSGPINGPTSYHLYCYNQSGGIGSSDAYGSTDMTVYPTAPTRSTPYISASPSSVTSGNASTLSWSVSPGNNYSTAYMGGGRFGGYVSSSGSASTGALTANTQYYVQPYDTQFGWETPAYVTVAVTAAPPSDVCTDISGAQASVPSGCSGPTPAPVGACIPSGKTYNGTSCVPASTCDAAAHQTGTPPNCTCVSGYQMQGGTCVAIPVCSGAHQTGTPPNCMCDVGFQMQGGSCVQVQCPGAHESNWPACSCDAGYMRDGGTSMCIRQPALSITANGQSALRVRKGTDVTVAWSATGVAAGSCSVTTNAGATLGSGDSGSVTATVGSQTAYRLTCTNDAGTAVSKEANVTLIPEVIEQ